MRRWRVKGAMLKTVRGDCRNGGAEEEVDIEETRMGWRPVAAAGLYCKAGLRFRASELIGRRVRPCGRARPLLKGELHPRIVRGCVDGK